MLPLLSQILETAHIPTNQILPTDIKYLEYGMPLVGLISAPNRAAATEVSSSGSRAQVLSSKKRCMWTRVGARSHPSCHPDLSHKLTFIALGTPAPPWFDVRVGSWAGDSVGAEEASADDWGLWVHLYCIPAETCLHCGG